MDLSLDSTKNEKISTKRKKNGKTNSMNQSLLSKIVKDKIPKKNPLAKKRPQSSAQESMESIKTEERNISFHSNRVHDFESTVASKYKKTNGTVIHTCANGRIESVKTLKKVDTKLNTFHNNIPKGISIADPKIKNCLIKPNNSASYLDKLKSDLVGKSSLKSEHTIPEKETKSSSGATPGKQFDYKRLLEELMEAKHKNSKLENEIRVT